MKPATFVLLGLAATAAAAADLRPPAVPLVANDPYFSIWSTTDRLADSATRHWTGTPQPLTALIRIDGATLRLMGAEPKTLPALDQQRLQVTPTRSIYRFQGRGVELELTFLTPLLPDDLDILSRPVTYLTWKLQSADGRPHAVQLYFDASASVAVNTPEQAVVWGRARIGSLDVLRAANKDQPVLEKWGDNLRIDWGQFFVAATGARSSLTPPRAARGSFIANGTLPADDDLEMPRADSRRDPAPVLAVSFDLGNVAATPVERHVILAYDDQFSIEYFHRKLRPYWRRKGATAADLLSWAERDYASLTARAVRFDEALSADLRRLGGEKYEQLASLAYRQAIAGHKLAADLDGTPLFFPKENFSNGCISTVDVFYPSAPLFLLVSPKLLEASMQPVFDYARVGRWKFPFAPHDLGTYPQANGQVYGGGEKTEENQMPVEESGNMLILTAALAEAYGNTEFASRYWTLLETWAAYLKEKGLDPDNQLSTDDFAGHLAHNANLSLKAILALESFASLAEKTGHTAQAAEYHRLTRDYAARWEKLAADGDHYPPGLRRLRHLEPEVQPGVGPPARLQPLPAGNRAQRDGVLQDEAGTFRPPAGQPQALHQARLDPLDCHHGRVPSRFRSPGGARLALRQRIAHARPAHRLVLDHRRQTSRLPGPNRRRRPLHQTASRPCRLEEVGPGRRPLMNGGARPLRAHVLGTLLDVAEFHARGHQRHEPHQPQRHRHHHEE